MAQRRSLFLPLGLSLLGLACVATAAGQEVTQEAGRETKKETVPLMGRRIAGIEFRGNRAFSSETILGSFKFMKTGGKYHPEKLESELDRLRVLLYVDNGYLQMRAGKPELEDAPDGLRITIPINEGVCYRIGEIKIEDARLFSPDEILEILGWRRGDIVKGYSVIHTGLELLKSLYGDRGYVQFDAYFQPTFHDPPPGMDEAAADIKLSLEEGDPYRIDKIVFKAADSLDEKQLRSQLSLHAGDLYNQSLFRKSLERLNHFLGRFAIYEEVGEDSVAFQTDYKTKQVQLTITLRQK